jgi:hypothetical protein
MGLLCQQSHSLFPSFRTLFEGRHRADAEINFLTFDASCSAPSSDCMIYLMPTHFIVSGIQIVINADRKIPRGVAVDFEPVQLVAMLQLRHQRIFPADTRLFGENKFLSHLQG